MARSLAGKSEDPDDLVQDATHAALIRPPRQAGSLRSWFAVTIARIAKNRRRGTARRSNREAMIARTQETTAPAPEDLVLRLEMQRSMIDELLALAPELRAPLVLRYFDERPIDSIATALGIPRDTVRDRLRRGLLTLRSRLGVTDEERPDRRRALFLVLGEPMRHAGKAAAASLLLGGFFVSKPIAGLVVMVAAVGSLTVPALFSTVAPTVVNEPSAPVALAPPAQFGAPSESREEPVARESIVESSPSSDWGLELPPPGGISLSVYDPLEPETSIGFEARFLNDSRYAQSDGQGNFTLALTAGHWKGTIHARGFEPLFLPDFDLTANSQLALGSFPLVRGTSRIEGRVDAPFDTSGKPYVIDLFSDHVRPCTACEKLVRDGHITLADGRHAPCPFCGFFDDRRRRTVRAGGLFQFEGLVSGDYALRAFAAENDPLGTQSRVIVKPGGSTFVTMEMRGFCDGEVETLDEEGLPVTGLFEEEGSLVSRRIDFEITALDGTAVTATYRPPVPEQRESKETVVALGSVAWESRMAFVQERRAVLELNRQVITTRLKGNVLTGTLGWIGEPSDRNDRERTEDDRLTKSWNPTCQGVDAPEVKVLVPGNRFSIERLPVGQYTLVVRCGTCVSDPIPLDLRLCPAPAVRAVLKQTKVDGEETEAAINADLEVSLGALLDRAGNRIDALATIRDANARYSEAKAKVLNARIWATQESTTNAKSSK